MVSSEVARMLPGARLVALRVLRDESCLTPAADAYTRAAQALEDLLDHYTAATAKGWVPQRKKV